MIVAISVLAGLSILVGGTGPTAAVTSPFIATLTASPSPIYNGMSSVLAFQTTATDGTVPTAITVGGSTVSLITMTGGYYIGTLLVSPSATTNYSLVVNGSTVSQTSLAVNTPPAYVSPTSITTAAIATDGTWLINGTRTLIISGQKLDLQSWNSAGYSLTQAKAYLSALTDAGLNCIMANWGTDGLTNNDLTLDHWNFWGHYWIGTNTNDPRGIGNAYLWGDTKNIQSLVTYTQGKNYPNLMSWTVAAELSPEVSWATQALVATPSASGGILPSGQRFITVMPVDGTNTEKPPTTVEVSPTVVGPSGSIALSWSAFGLNAGGYHVYDGTASGQQPHYFAVPAGQTTFTVTSTANATAAFISSNQYAYANAVSATAFYDSHPVGDLIIFNTNFKNFLSTTYNSFPREESTNQPPFVLYVTPSSSSPVNVASNIHYDSGWVTKVTGQLSDAMSNMHTNAGANVSKGLSVTSVGELTSYDPNFYSPPLSEVVFQNSTYAMFRRWWIYGAMAGCKAFELLWGPSQRASTWTGGDYPLYSQFPWYLGSRWAYNVKAMTEIKDLGSIIIDAATFSSALTCVPMADGLAANGLNGWTLVNSQPVFQGVWAVKKTVSTTTYVFAMNLNQTTTPTIDGTFPNAPIDVSATNVTINVGQTITNAIRWKDDLTQGVVTFTGVTITDNFAPAEVHIYLVT